MLRIQVGVSGIFRKCISALAVLWLLPGPSAKAQAEWIPSKPIEFVVMAGEKGSSAKAADLIAEIIQERKLAPISFKFVYKEHQSGAEGLSYLIKARDPNHTILISSTSYYSLAALHRNLGSEVSLFTPIAGMGVDVFLLWVQTARQDIKDLPSLIQAARDKKKTTGQDWVMAGYADQSTDSLLTAYLNVTYQLNMKYMSCPSGGDAALALVEGRADSAVSTPSAQADPYQANKTKPIVAFSQSLPENLASVPKFSEAEKKFSIEVPRMIVGPKGMSLDAQTYFVHLLHKVFTDPEWETYRQKNGLHGKFLTGPALVDHTLEQMNAHKIMAEVIDVMKILPASPAR
jgi:putative tricarboxylic transport membrane protein